MVQWPLIQHPIPSRGPHILLLYLPTLSLNVMPLLRAILAPKCPSVRKALFQNFLWSPQTPSPAGIDSSSPKDCDVDPAPHPPVGSREPGLSRESITAETYRIGLINYMSRPSVDTRGHSDFSDRSVDPVVTKLTHCLLKPKHRTPLVTPVPKSDSYHNFKPSKRVHVCLLNCHSVKNKAQSV